MEMKNALKSNLEGEVLANALEISSHTTKSADNCVCLHIIGFCISLMADRLNLLVFDYYPSRAIDSTILGGISIPAA